MAKATKLDGIKTWQDVTDENGSIKMLSLYLVDIVRAEHYRHVPIYAANDVDREKLAMQRTQELERKLIFFKEASHYAERTFGLDCSGFYSAIRHIVPRQFWWRLK
jgi:hypothetical protein